MMMVSRPVESTSMVAFRTSRCDFPKHTTGIPICQSRSSRWHPTGALLARPLPDDGKRMNPHRIAG